MRFLYVSHPEPVEGRGTKRLEVIEGSGNEIKSRLRLHEACELLVEAREAAAAIHQLLLTAGPGGMRCRIDVERELLAGRAPGRAGLVGRAVVETDFDEMIVGVDALFHG